VLLLKKRCFAADRFFYACKAVRRACPDVLPSFVRGIGLPAHGAFFFASGLTLIIKACYYRFNNSMFHEMMGNYE